MNLYIFNETRRGAIFGIGTYIRELVIALKDSDIHISIINLMSDKPQIQIDNIDGINYWYFPNPILELRTSEAKGIIFQKYSLLAKNTYNK